jgi:hypothetical protein
MSKANLLINLRGYEGNNANSSPNNFNANFQYVGMEFADELIQKITVGAGDTVSIFSVAPADAKKMIYAESDGECDIIINGTAESKIKPVLIGDSMKNGVFLKTSDIYSMSITNNGTEDINIYCIALK